MSDKETLWRTSDRSRNFIIPDSTTRPPGTLTIRSLGGVQISADEGWLRRFEISDQEARDWAQRELGAALGELKGEIDAGLAHAREALEEAGHAPVAEDTDITPDAVPALMALVRKLPRAILIRSPLTQDRCRPPRKSSRRSRTGCVRPGSTSATSSKSFLAGSPVFART